MQKIETVTETREKMTDLLCDVCGVSCKHPTDYEHGSFEADWGYDSTQDGEHHRCDLCEDCYKKVRAFIESLGGKIRIEHDL